MQSIAIVGRVVVQSIAQAAPIGLLCELHIMVKLSDIAKQAGVSESTVSRALAHSPRISAQKKHLIQQIAFDAGYKVNQVARNLRVRSTLTIGLVVPEVTNPYFPRLVQLIADSARVAGYRLQLHLSGSAQDAEADCLTSLREQRVDGVVLVTSENGLVARDALNDMVSSGMPVVLLGWVSEMPDVDMVYGDDAAGGYLIANYLMQLGHRRIATLGLAPHRGPFDRLVGFKRGLSEGGILTDLEIPGRTDDEIRVGIENLLKLQNPPTAIFAYQDSLAAMACRYLRQSCISIPAEISVVGFDNLILGTYLCPQLTTVDLSMEEMASSAIDVLVDRMKSLSTQRAANHLLIQPRLIVRESCTHPRAIDSIKWNGESCPAADCSIKQQGPCK